ncbi:MAG: GNAT family N-acetyltransferase [Proteobacteria bacterium]|nr:GNAT family N-acetyltransferase [Pseudomonadota bacterium]
MSSNLTIRPATANDAIQTAEVFLAARARMTYLPNLHTEDDTRAFIGGLAAQMEVWVAEIDARVTGFAAVRDGWLDHLYVHPSFQNREIGTALLAKVKTRRPEGFQFWAFQANDGARRFYERQGCTAVEFTDGQGNEEKVPDVRYVWRRKT